MIAVIVWIITHQLPMIGSAGLSEAHHFFGVAMCFIAMAGGLIWSYSSISEMNIGCLAFLGGFILGPVLYILGLWAIPLAVLGYLAYVIGRKLYFRKWQKFT